MKQVLIGHLYNVICVCVDRASEPAVFFGGVSAAVPQRGCAGSGGALSQAQRQVQ